MNMLERKQSRTEGRPVFQLSPVAVGCAVFLTLLGTQSSAQTTQGETAEPVKIVTVTGIRRSIEDAIEVKRESSSIVETISAEDIGKLPDISIAESLARLPGVSAQRVNGQAKQISIRGTSGDLSTALLNGREQVSTSPNRTVEYDQYPSELINAVTVYKTSDAALVGQGLSGTVDLKTIKPLSLREHVVTLNVRGEKNGQGKVSPGSKDMGSRVSMSYVDQFLNRTLGVAVGYARADKPNESRGFETWDWVDKTNVVPGKTVKVPKGIKSLAQTGNQVRDGLIGVVEWHPIREFTSTVDAYHSRFKLDEDRRGMEVDLSSVRFTPATINSDGIMRAGTANNVNPVVRNNHYHQNDVLTAYGWNNKFISGDWTLVADVSHSQADHKEELDELNTGLASRQTMTFDYANGNVPNIALSGVYDDPSKLTIGGQYGPGYINAPHIRDKLNSFRASAEYKFENNLFNSVEVGFNASKRDKQKQHLESGLSTVGNGTITPDEVTGSQSLYGLPNSLTWNIPTVLSQNYAPHTLAILVPWGATKNWSITEKVQTGYAKLNIDTELMSMPLHGNVGIQAVHTDQSSTSQALRAYPFSDLVPISDGKKYNDYLPSINLIWSLPEEQIIRFGANKTLARARLDQLNASRSVGLSNGSTGEPFGSGGNAKLDPWRANAVDLSWEKYFGNKGYVQAAGFYKDLKSYIYSVTGPYDFSQYNLQGATSNIGNMTQPMNGKGGKLQGLELAASVPLDMFNPMLSGFGVVANAAFTTSDIAIKTQSLHNMNIPLPGLSKRVFNVTAYYENNGFSARVSQRYRSSFVAEIGSIGGSTTLTFEKPDRVVDLQLGYNFKSVEGLSVLFQVNNLTNTAFQTYLGLPNTPRAYTKYGRQMLFGFNYKL